MPRKQFATDVAKKTKYNVPSTWFNAPDQGYSDSKSVETKYVKATITSNLVSATAPVIFLANGIQQGAEAGQRIGNQCKPKSLELKFCIGLPNTLPIYTAATEKGIKPVFAKLVVFIDKSNNNMATPPASNLWLAPTSKGGGTFNSLSFQNKDYQNRFLFLLEQPMVLGGFFGETTNVGQTPGGPGGFTCTTDPGLVSGKIYIDLTKKEHACPLTFSMPTASQSSIVSGAIFVAFLSSGNTSATADSPHRVVCTTKFAYTES